MQDIYCKIENIVYNRAIKIRKEKPVAKNLKLKMARVEHDMTQGDLADAIGVTRQTIGLIEAGKYNPTHSMQKSITCCSSSDGMFSSTSCVIVPNATFSPWYI